MSFLFSKSFPESQGINPLLLPLEVQRPGSAPGNDQRGPLITMGKKDPSNCGRAKEELGGGDELGGLQETNRTQGGL